VAHKRKEPRCAQANRARIAARRYRVPAVRSQEVSLESDLSGVPDDSTSSTVTAFPQKGQYPPVRGGFGTPSCGSKTSARLPLSRFQNCVTLRELTTTAWWSYCRGPMKYRRTWDLASIPDDLLRSEWGRRNAAKRAINRGGRAPSCTCGECRTCRKREAVRVWRARQKRATKRRAQR